MSDHDTRRSATHPFIVSIVILNWNKADLTIDCVRLVEEHADIGAYEIIVVDNGSTADQVSVLKSGLPSSVHAIWLSENMFFGEANNIGVEAATGEFVLLLNNDVQVTSGFLVPLIKTFANEYSVGAVGAKFLYPDGTLQEAGAFILPDGMTFQHGKFGMEIADKFTRGSHIVDYCSAACLLLRREIFLAIGGFDPLFDPAYFEDVDLALRLRARGLYTYYCSESVVYHLENVTSRAVWSQAQLNDVAGRNHQKFIQRWSRYLSNRLSADIEPPAFAEIEPSGPVEPTSPRRKLLLTTSGRMEISDLCHDMLSAATRLDVLYDIDFAALERCSKLRVRSLCRDYGIALKSDRVLQLKPDLLADYDHVLHFGPDNNMDNGVGRIHLASETGVIDRLLGL